MFSDLVKGYYSRGYSCSFVNNGETRPFNGHSRSFSSPFDSSFSMPRRLGYQGNMVYQDPIIFLIYSSIFLSTAYSTTGGNSFGFHGFPGRSGTFPTWQHTPLVALTPKIAKDLS